MARACCGRRCAGGHGPDGGSVADQHARCLIDHRKPLAEAVEAFELAGRRGALKVVVRVGT